MTYEETLAYLYESTPAFHNVGQKAYKPGLATTHALDAHFGHPHRQYKTIHVAGTNGKGSCAHTLAAILQDAGYRVGLYTSPHLVDFSERIRVNGQCIPAQYVVDFVEKERTFFEPLEPSFFEITTALALKYFADENVDIAVIEVGLGGRLDCTNIIEPICAIITNISFDHTQFLGNTLADIASEKAGIIKRHIPVVIGETTDETRPVFAHKAQEIEAPIVFAEDEPRIKHSAFDVERQIRTYNTTTLGHLEGALTGLCQERNTNTILAATEVLVESGINLTADNIRHGFANVCQTTGLMGRWQVLEKGENVPTVICDTGHNPGGMAYIAQSLRAIPAECLHIIIGMVDDKDIDSVMDMLPKNARYYFTKASTHRAIPEKLVAETAARHHIKGNAYPNVAEAYETARNNACPADTIYIGGSTYVVGELLKYFQKLTTGV